MRLWLLRHARPWVAPGVCYGRLDVAAHALPSQRAAQALIHAIDRERDSMLLPIKVRSSPAQRCTALTHWLTDAGMSTRFDDRLLELDFGAWEGQRWDALPASAFDAWTTDFAHGRPGHRGESVAELLTRVDAALAEWRAADCDEVWVTHAGVIRAVQWLMRGRGLPTAAADWNLPAPDFGGWLSVTAAG